MLPPKELLLFFSQAHERGKSQVQNRAMHLILTVLSLPACVFPVRLWEHRAGVLLFTFVKVLKKTKSGNRGGILKYCLLRAAVTIVWRRGKVCLSSPPTSSHPTVGPSVGIVQTSLLLDCQFLAVLRQLKGTQKGDLGPFAWPDECFVRGSYQTLTRC